MTKGFTCLTTAVFLLLVLSVSALPTGAPTSACSNLRPSHPASPIDPLITSTPFFIVTDLIEENRGQFTAGQTYDITLMGVDATFRGFVVQARSAADGSLIGTFVENSADIQPLTCSGDPDSTITHTNNNDKSSVSFQWTAPGGTGGTVELRYSIVTGYQQNFYANLNAANFRLACQFTPTPIGEHSLIFRQPENCLRESCDYFLGLNQNMDNSSFIDVYLEGNAAGWIAIGFSLNLQMENDDVLGCRVDSGSVTVVDTWNPSPRHSPNVLDNTQAGLCVQSTSFVNNRITCQFSRTIKVTDIGQDYDLDNMYWLFFGRRAAAQTSGNNLGYHTANGGMTPTASAQMFNPVRDNNTEGACPISATAIDQHRLIFGIPSGCSRESCDYYLGLSPNPDNSDYLDVYLEGNAAGWIAVGFSQNLQMENDDVLGCRVDSSSVTVVDTWNPSPRHSPNVLDATQDGLCVQSTSFVNNRITCRFSRTIIVTDIGQDYDLDNMYWLFFGRRAAAQTSGNNLGYHTANGGMTPTASAQMFNPVRDNNTLGCPPTPTGDITYTFMFGSPGSDFYFAARVNPNNPLYVDMRIEGTANGWVGVGFTPNRTMDDADVLGCVRNPSDNMVAVVDSYNPVPRYAANRLDTNQDGVCIYNTSAIDGRLICSFSRLIAPVNPADDFDLSTPLFQLYGTSNNGGPPSAALSQHTGTPDITTSTVVLTTDSGVTLFPRIQLLKVHGILMLLAWPLLVVSAIFFAAWMKPALPNGEWFQVHRAFMITSLVLTAAGFVFAFVANAKNEAVRPGLISFACSKNTSHFVIGFIVFILQIINPIIAICRCKPNSSKRWIFNISHATLIGFTAELLALANVGLGIALLESGGCSPLEISQYRVLWLYIAFVCFLVILQVSLFFIFTLTALNASPEKRPGLAPSLIKCLFISDTDSSQKKSQDIEMTVPRQQKKDKEEPPPRKEPSKDSPIRWGAFTIFVLVTLSVMVALIVMIAIE